MSFLRSLRNWFLRVLEKIEWCIPDRLLTHKAKIRRLIILEDKLGFVNPNRDKTEHVDTGTKDSALDLISSQPEQSASHSQSSGFF